MRVVLDTNVIVSGLMRKNTPADLVRQAWEAHRFTLVSSEWQLEELRRVSRYPRLQRYLRPHEVGSLVRQIRRAAIVLEFLPVIEASPDPDDDPILATALAGEAAWLVTGDKGDLLTLRKAHGVRMVTARAFLEILD
ncbi:MAG: putative toxin-antitoxin system toxin component, PIN family [Trueperaceae bacterium]|nr:putative toxin-antitoxin system toxin component, PIN family [Trueperaceae bacterium]